MASSVCSTVFTCQVSAYLGRGGYSVHPDVLPRYQRAIAADGLLSQLPVPAKFRQKDENDVWVTGGGTGGHPGTVLLEDAQLGIILLLGQLSHVIIHQVPCSSVIIDH